MAFCTNCGSEIANGAKFCTNCGAPQQPAHMEYGQNTAAQNIPMQGENIQGYSSQDVFGAGVGGNAAQSYANSGNYAGQAAGSAGYGGGYANASNASYGGSGYGTGIPQPVPGLSFMEAVKICFSKYATFEGRARRSEYWFFVLFNILMSIALGLIGNIILGVPEDGGTNMLQNLYSLAVLVPSLAVFWRRMHDIGKSGAWFFINFIPLIGQIILLVFEVRDSEPGENKYGMSPKYPA